MTQACMGGWCTKRGHCAHYHATNTTDPAERLCPPGQDGAGFITLQPQEDDMPRPYLSADERRQQAMAVLRDGISIAEIRDAMGYASNENATRVMDALVFAGLAFRARCKLEGGSDTKSWTTRFFTSAEARDQFVAAKDAEIAARKKERKAATFRRMPYYTNRTEARRLAREAKAQQHALELAQREAVRRAEAEQRKERARLEREAKAAEKARAKAAAKKAQQRLKAETRAAGKLAALKPANAAPVSVSARGPAFVAGDPDISRARITIAPPAPSRWAANNAASVVNSAQCRGWAKAVTA